MMFEGHSKILAVVECKQSAKLTAASLHEDTRHLRPSQKAVKSEEVR